MPAIKNAHIRYRIIDRCLRNKYRPFPSKEDLRAACEEELFGSEWGANICDSTIEKDLFNMRMEMDAPIKYSKLERGYYYEDENFSINDIPLSDEELESLRFATQTLMQFKNTTMFQQFGFAIDKIFDRIAATKDQNSDKESDIIQFERGFSSQGNEFLPQLLEAIKQRLICTFFYASFISGIRKLRKVLPLLLKEYRNRWYLISFDFDKKSIITYALERMDELTITKEVYTAEIEFNPKEFFEFSTGITAGSGKVEEIRLKAASVASKYIQSRPFHSSQKVIEETSEYCVFSMNVIESEELIRDLLSYGSELEILSPKSLRKEIQARIEKTAKLYVKK